MIDPDLSAKLRQLLQENNDFEAFMKGGCDIFALALFERRSYLVIRVGFELPEYPDHVWVQPTSAHEFGIDIKGFRTEDEILSDLAYAHSKKTISLEQLRQVVSEKQEMLGAEVSDLVTKRSIEILNRDPRFLERTHPFKVKETR